MRVVLDTNVIISAVLFGGRPAAVLRSFDEPAQTLLLSNHILVEIESVLRRKSRWPEQFIGKVRADLIRVAEWVEPAISIAVCRDPDDDRILEAAVAGRADCIVSGDADLLSMKSFQQIPILTVSAFLELTER